MQWLPEVKHYCGNNVSLVLVGLKIDLRSTESKTIISYQQVNIAHIHKKIIRADYFQGLKLAKEIGAKYGECSAKENIYVKEVIQLAAQMAIKPKRLFMKRNLQCNILQNPYIIPPHCYYYYIYAI